MLTCKRVIKQLTLIRVEITKYIHILRPMRVVNPTLSYTKIWSIDPIPQITHALVYHPKVCPFCDITSKDFFAIF
jgi:hypothetical protein